jgi:hypothetical protein
VEPFNTTPGAPFETMDVGVDAMASAMAKENVKYVLVTSRCGFTPNLIFCLFYRCLTAGLLFVSSDIYVNTARANPNLLIVDSARLKWKSTRKPAVGVMIGLVTECALITSSVMTGPRQNMYQTHRITIAPAPQEIRRDMSAWGQLFGFSTIKGPASELGIGFSTYGEGKAPGFVYACAHSPLRLPGCLF